MRTAGARVRIASLLVAALAAMALVAGCGGSGDQTATVGGGGTVTVPSDVYGLYGELEAILGQLPYQHWYGRCIVSQVEKLMTPKEAEGLADLPEAEREAKSNAIIEKAGPACEKSGRPIVDPNAPAKAFELLRSATVGEMVGLAESNGLSAKGVACIKRTFEAFPDKFLVELRNGTDKAREGILQGAFEPCGRLK